MDFQEKIQELRAEIKRQLEPIIGENCILTDLPYHDNLGDVLIWQGELDFLGSINKYPLSATSSETFLFPVLREDTTILLHGGGNFGDLYRNFQEFKLRVVDKYPKNKIVMFPQSVWYENSDLIKRDAAQMAKHNDLYLCARDKSSFDFLKKHFSANNILLVPDMAFYINDKRLEDYRHTNSSKKLYFKRTDKEDSDKSPIKTSSETDIRDWPKYGEKTLGFKFIIYSCAAIKRLNNLPFAQSIIAGIVNTYAEWYWRPSRETLAAKFLSRYGLIITSRLHALILSVLLHIPARFIDNTTGKLSAFYNQWLNNLDEIKPFK